MKNWIFSILTGVSRLVLVLWILLAIVAVSGSCYIIAVYGEVSAPVWLEIVCRLFIGGVIPLALSSTWLIYKSEVIDRRIK